MAHASTSGPVLVRSAAEEDPINEENAAALSTSEEAVDRRRLSVSVSEEVLHSVSEHTSDLREKLNKFVNGLNSKILSVPSSSRDSG